MPSHPDKDSKHYTWLINLKSLGFNEFWFHNLPCELRDQSSLQKSVDRRLLIPIYKNSKGIRKWKLNIPSTSKKL